MTIMSASDNLVILANGGNSNKVSSHFVMKGPDTGTRSHSLKLFAHHSRIDARKYFCVIALYGVGIVCLLHLPIFFSNMFQKTFEEN